MWSSDKVVCHIQGNIALHRKAIKSNRNLLFAILGEHQRESHYEVTLTFYIITFPFFSPTFPIPSHPVAAPVSLPYTSQLPKLFLVN